MEIYDKLTVGCKYFESWEFDRIKCKVSFYNSCGIFKKILFALIHGRNFVPTQNEKQLVYWYNHQEELK